MKKLLTLLVLSLALHSRAIILINISDFPNINNPGTNYLILFTQPGVTNYNMNMLQFEGWLANEPTFTSALLANPLLPFNKVTWSTQTNSSSIIWTNTTSYTNATGNFTNLSIYNPSPVTHSHLVISNAASFIITDTLPFAAYSESLATNITQIYIPVSSVLDLQFDYYNGVYFLRDYGVNNTTLYQLATSNTYSGALYITNGHIYIH